MAGRTQSRSKYGGELLLALPLYGQDQLIGYSEDAQSFIVSFYGHTLLIVNYLDAISCSAYDDCVKFLKSLGKRLIP